MIDPPVETFNFTVSLQSLEWIVGAMLTAGMSVAGWVWRMSVKIDELEATIERQNKEIANMEKEIETGRNMMRSIGTALDKKFDTETMRLKEQIGRLGGRLEEVREELPSRSFIEGQFNLLTSRIDRSIDSKR